MAHCYNRSYDWMDGGGSIRLSVRLLSSAQCHKGFEVKFNKSVTYGDRKIPWCRYDVGSKMVKLQGGRARKLGWRQWRNFTPPRRKQRVGPVVPLAKFSANFSVKHVRGANDLCYTPKKPFTKQTTISR